MKIDRLTPTTTMLGELGTRLARVRKQQDLSQDSLAEAAGVGVATLRRIEAGQDAKLGSWLRLLVALERTDAIEALLPERLRSPMAEAKATGRRTPKPPSDGDGFTWGDERP
ncbi:MAG: helix-turn-helix domain-containing protein [Planctomycetes bacterium]|nr:helix-turn-helix domain-containing protein [Planctomycetota bacterium]